MMKINEFRVAIRADDFEETARMFRDVLGFEQMADWSGDNGKGILVALPEATLEILSSQHSDYIDEFELGRTFGNPVRFALSVDSVEVASSEMKSSGTTEVLAPVRRAPWGDEVQRLGTPAGIQLTLFSVKSGDDDA